MRALTVGLCAVCITSSVMLGATTAHADRNDLTLERIVGMPTVPGTFNDPTDPVRQTMYKSLMSELSVVMAPRPLSPADTLGYSGFQVAFETSFTQISNNADYWQRGVENVSSSFLPTVSVMARKGIWLPLPGFEIGAGATKLIDSNMYAVNGYAKLALHEGFHNWALPSFAVRGAVSHLLGASQVDLTTLSIDAALSKSFGLGGTVTLDPYVGAAVLLSFVRAQVIDTTPNTDAFTDGPASNDVNANTTFPDPDTIVRWRVFAGFRLLYAFFALTGEFVYTFCNDTASSCGKTSPMSITDRSAGQAQINFSGSFVF
ncbi:MAG: hypothetical protein JWN44_1784 [Myxococcales bacterium]|nr:hypothetical protein [Myxococcales bacterium]